jgi:hypothetical protein
METSTNELGKRVSLIPKRPEFSAASLIAFSVGVLSMPTIIPTNFTANSS